MLLLLRRLFNYFTLCAFARFGNRQQLEKRAGCNDVFARVRTSHKRKFLNQLLVYRGNTAVLYSGIAVGLR
jgi:hypothetical protein